jgi:hypothetical protein
MNRDLCLQLLGCETDAELQHVLGEAGLLDDPKQWRLYGDMENNWSIVGNQQARADAALMEKVVNSIDAVLLGEVQSRGIDPTDPQNAPGSITDAVVMAFDGDSKSQRAGRVANWDDKKRREVSRNIALYTTGEQGSHVSFNVADLGEGQAPDRVPETLMSIARSNKQRVPFVQGKHNQGGTGVVRHCAAQVIVTRRRPDIVSEEDGERAAEWSVTVVRQVEPAEGFRSPSIKYLVGTDDKVLSFPADTMPILPEEDRAYSKEVEWGTLVKMLDYDASGFSGNALQSDGVFSRINALLVDVALPVRVHECRNGYSNKPGSRELTAAGLRVRLEDNKANNIEPNFPQFFEAAVEGERLRGTIYAFKKEPGQQSKARRYRKASEGVVFVLNGQVHTTFAQHYFRKDSVKLGRLAASLLVIIDISDFSAGAINRLFMTSRDRMVEGALSAGITDVVSRELRENSALRALMEKRWEEQTAHRLKDSQPLNDVLRKVLRASPELSALLKPGDRVEKRGPLRPTGQIDTPFQGKPFPTYFRLRKKSKGSELERATHRNERARIQFETDADNDYFDRENDPAELVMFRLIDGTRTRFDGDYVRNLVNGIATISITLPGSTAIGEKLTFETVVTDPSRPDPFVEHFTITVLEDIDRTARDGGSRRKPPTDTAGDQRQTPGGLTLPNINEVRREQWDEMGFNGKTAMTVERGGPSGESDEIEFSVNLDNDYLVQQVKRRLQPGVGNLVETKFSVACVQVGLALLASAQRHDGRDVRSDGDVDTDSSTLLVSPDNVDDAVRAVTEALAPVLLPMIDAVSSISSDLGDVGDSDFDEGDGD